MESITSVRLNYLVYRYLQESGFTRAAFNFGFETGLNKSSIDGSLVPPGALVKFVHKGLQFVEMEANVTNAEIDDEDFIFLQPLDLITKDIRELNKLVKNERNSQQGSRHKELDATTDKSTGIVKDCEGKDKTKTARGIKG